MARFADTLLQPEPWAGLMMGNHALVRAMLEAGVRVVAAYPGSPTPEIADALESMPADKRPLHFEWSTNEKVAVETAFGATINGHTSVCFFKSVGLNVALDSFVQLSMLRCAGGMVVIIGDDPGANSSQNEQDNRHIARMSYYPVFQPGTPTEAYQMLKEALALSKKLSHPMVLRMTTHVCHAREVIQFGRIDPAPYDWTSRYNPQGLEYWPITANCFPLKLRAFANIERVREYAETSPSTAYFAPNGAPPGPRRLGVISEGIPAWSVLESFDQSDAQVDLLKLGITYPLPSQRILEFLRSHDEVLVLEELDRIIETDIKALAFDNGITTKIHTKPRAVGQIHEYDPHRAYELLSQTWPDCFPPRMAAPSPTGMMLARTAALSPDSLWDNLREVFGEVIPAKAALPQAAHAVAPRLAQMCPGCGHRSAFFAIRELLEAEYPDAIVVGDIGCHTIGYLPPHNMGEVLLCMGHSNGTAAGLDINNTRPIVTFIGDSTLYHAGLPAIANATMHKHNITLVVLENFTTAMTGHQPTAGSGEFGQKLNIPDILHALGVEHVASVDAYLQDQLKEKMRESLALPGFSVVIAKHPCMLKFLREKARKLAARQVAAAAPRS